MGKKKKQKQEPFAEEASVDALSFEELELLRTSVSQAGEDRSQLPPHDNSDRAHVWRFAKKNKLLAVAVIILVTALVAGVIFGSVFLYRQWSNRPNTDDFTVKLGDEKPYSVKYDYAVRDGIFYIDLRKLAAFADLIVSGSETKLKFTASNDCSLIFENNSELARINGEQVEMLVLPIHSEKRVSAKAIITAEECLIPYEFFRASVSEGLLFHLDNETNTLQIRRVYHVYDGDMENKKAAGILFAVANGYSVIPDETEPPKYEYFYTIDISPYLDSILAEDLLLANKQTPLGEDFKPEVVDLTCATDGEVQRLQKNAERALFAMMEEMKAEGVTDVFVTSSYRDYAHQNWLYYTYYYGVEKANHPDWSDEQIYTQISTYSSLPGESEHQTGLCVDFTTQSIGGNVANTFEKTDAFAWLSQNAYKFGFILRYPQNKVDVTQYNYESWHYRFVGRTAATEIYFSGMCLEEYLSDTQEP
ncbi:MAG: D-alanyl-D-alanine carboxypeptidase family protein [Ruminococcaceae bacterium]|nr:D-alanyl-D-alanine carboxypeptidase family protein [Oscillospiraceae bacterium]